MTTHSPFSEVSISTVEIDAFREKYKISKKEFTYLLGYPRKVWARKISEMRVIVEPPHLVLAIQRLLYLDKIDEKYILREVSKAKENVKKNIYTYN